MTKVLIATDKPFAPVAVKGIREIVEAQGYELALLEKYTSPEELIAAVADVDAMIIRSDKATKEVIDAAKKLKVLRDRTRMLWLNWYSVWLFIWLVISITVNPGMN